MPDRGHLTKSRTRMLTLFASVEDEWIRYVVGEVVELEARYRSRQNRPLKQIRGLIESVARLQEAGKPVPD